MTLNVADWFSSRRLPSLRASARNARDASNRHIGNEKGVAVLIALIALSIFSILGLSLALNTATEVRMSDNYESQVQAGVAAMAGLNHSRELLRGLSFDDQLVGPNGTTDKSIIYLTQARSHEFRNPLDWQTARSLNILSPMSELGSYSDDGLLNTGHLGTTNGTMLLPLAGIALTAPNPYSPEADGNANITTSRYFVKVTDNNGEASELALDPADNPFMDSDHIIIVRSMGIAQTIGETAGNTARRNSVAVYEARFKRRMTFDLDAPFVIQGDDVLPSGPNMWDGAAFRINGGSSNYGIATIDTDTGNFTMPSERISSQLDPYQENNIRGMGFTPSIMDITGSISADPDTALLLDPDYLWNYVNNILPYYADNVFEGDQHWSGESSPDDLGSYDVTKPDSHPSQNPKLTFVNGNLDIGGNISGGGTLIVSGKLTGNGALSWNGLVLVIGAGDVDGSGLNVGLNGGLYICNITEGENGGYVFGTPKFTWRGNSNVTMHGAAIQSSMRLLPLVQLSFREITSVTDPPESTVPIW